MKAFECLIIINIGRFSAEFVGFSRPKLVSGLLQAVEQVGVLRVHFQPILCADVRDLKLNSTVSVLVEKAIRMNFIT